eukprot:jgi/Chlat1/5988/Chrsp4S06298
MGRTWRTACVSSSVLLVAWVVVVLVVKAAAVESLEGRAQQLLCADGGTQCRPNRRHHRPLPEERMTTAEILRYYGYPCEEHEVKSKPIVFLQHGLLGSSANWIINMPDQSLGYLLADAGFDVWLGNVRGNVYSMRHTSLSPLQDEFWRFSWDEMALLDLPAMLEYAMATSGRSSVYYIGFSQGTLIAFAGFSANHTLAAKVDAFFALGPVAYVGLITSPIAKLAPLSKNPELAQLLLGKKQFLASTKLMKWLGGHLCSEAPLVCEDVVFLISGFHQSAVNASRVAVYMSHNPAGTSVQNILHFAQNVQDRRFQRYDFGTPGRNYDHYEQPIPPQYHPRDMPVPVALYCGTKDKLADIADVALMKPELQHLISYKEIEGYEHVDFMWAIDARELVYDDIISYINAQEETIVSA